MTYLMIFIGGGLGSLARYLVSKTSESVFSTDFPLGTFISNILACILLALLINFFSNKADEYQWMQQLLMIGFCGGFSTFSTFSHETFELIDTGNHVLAILNILISVAVGIGLIYMIRLKS